jgi:Tfp pilus assembly protein PilF
MPRHGRHWRVATHRSARTLALDPAKVAPEARAAVAKALELDPNLAEAHGALARIKLWYDWDWTGAEREFRRAIELNPNDSMNHRNVFALPSGAEALR